MTICAPVFTQWSTVISLCTFLFTLRASAWNDHILKVRLVQDSISESAKGIKVGYWRIKLIVCDVYVGKKWAWAEVVGLFRGSRETNPILESGRGWCWCSWNWDRAWLEVYPWPWLRWRWGIKLWSTHVRQRSAPLTPYPPDELLSPDPRLTGVRLQAGRAHGCSARLVRQINAGRKQNQKKTTI